MEMIDTQKQNYYKANNRISSIRGDSSSYKVSFCQYNHQGKISGSSQGSESIWDKNNTTRFEEVFPSQFRHNQKIGC